MMLDYCLESEGEMGIASIKKYSKTKTDPFPPVEELFGYGRIVHKEFLNDGRSNIILEGMGVARLEEYTSTEPFRIAVVTKLDPIPMNKHDEELFQMIEELIVLTKRILLREGADDELILRMNSIQFHSHPIDFISSILHYDFGQKQEILVMTDNKERAQKLKRILEKLILKD